MLFSILYLLIFIHAKSVFGCPEHPVPPCTCRMIGYHACMITCMNVENEMDLVKSLRSMRNTTVPIQTVEIFEVTINFLPSDAFSGLVFPKLFIAGSSMVALSESDIAFEGLEDCLKILIVQECFLQSGWRWYHLKNMRVLTELNTMHAGLTAIDEDVKAIAHLNITNIFFTKDSISYIDDSAFSTFHNLVTLSLKMNDIEILKRSMFPNPALKLEQLILRHNKIQSIPKDLFTNMPNLKSIILSNNQMFYLDENLFKPVWLQLKKIDVEGNPMKCDCRMKWLLKLPYPKNTWGQCEQPRSLKGTEIKKLVGKDLWC